MSAEKTSPRLPLALAVVGFAYALVAFGAAGRLDVRVLAPAADAILTAGEAATLEWTAPPLPAEIEEWEAFLSLDGGRHYPYRITPHLDASRRRFTFRVPDLASTDVRLLLRFGDESQEHEVELDTRLEIRSAHGSMPEPLAELASAPGEAVRPGLAGAVIWTEGGRDGSDVHRVGTALAAGWHGREEPPLWSATDSRAAEAPRDPDGSAASPLARSLPSRARRSTVPYPRPLLVSLSVSDRLARLSRRNE